MKKIMLILLLTLISCGKENISLELDQIQSALITPEKPLTSNELATMTILDLNPITGQPMRPYLEWYTTYPNRAWTLAINQYPRDVEIRQIGISDWSVRIKDNSILLCDTPISFIPTEVPTYIHFTRYLNNCQVDLIDPSSPNFPINVQRIPKFWNMSEFEWVMMVIGQRTYLYVLSNGEWVYN